MTTPSDALTKAFKDCDLDCAEWDYAVLRELADIAIDGLDKAGFCITFAKHSDAKP